VDRAQLFYIEKLGSGQFGDVFKMATRLFSPAGQQCFVAVKMLKPDGEDVRGGDDDSLPTGSRAGAEVPAHLETGELPAAATAIRATKEREFLNEVEVMKRLRHPRLVALLGVCTQARPYMMILEYLPGGSLDQWLPENGAAAHPDGLVRILHQVASAFVALGDVGVVHRDLAARNVLIDERSAPLFCLNLCIFSHHFMLERDHAITPLSCSGEQTSPFHRASCTRASAPLCSHLYCCV
jgi:serine/threonine protein kinase